MSETAVGAYDPDTTPNSLADEIGMDWQPPGIPLAPHPVGETFTDGEGNHRHVSPREDGTSVAIQANHKKPWLDVQGHGEASDKAHAQGEDNSVDKEN